ncbi:DNA repair ATPase [Actinophytocola oryzae]|uniref:ATPase family protein associated with various cellular activities (AAA) n=1 Tax=Actinophytocola oryzae TaxID=502181 RepID=A0A4V6Q6Q0_9PSEU|nr:DNA repair ATPase [Actinophytocola oryzae]TDV46841.1 ATPase family protein associated with various cellular activities (AAA) [Actinophytocola oryzae]
MTATVTAPATVQDGLDARTYEVLRARLADQAKELARRAETLNTRRLEAFGATVLRLVGNERIRTEHNCVPRDIVSIPDGDGDASGLMLFGYNVFIGLRPETTVDDVFSLHRFTRDGEAFRFEDAGGERPELLADERFRCEFTELYRYYRETRLMQLRPVEGKLLAVFQTGPRTEDIKVLRWAVGADGTLSYLDNVGERDHVFPAAHDFEWTETTRDHHVLGRHPHISVEDELFIETVGGDLTVKIENNTEVGEGIYREPVDEPLQSLADADVRYARVGPLILLKILPYNEKTYRYLVFNTRTKTVVRLDGIGQACQRLPEDQGIIFPGGYYLATGVSRTFDTETDDLEFERVIRSPNGEDVLYVFHARREGRSLLLPYNVIRKEVANPLPCHGYSLFEDGTLVAFRATSEEPTRVHPMQVWQTPYVTDSFAAAQPVGTGPLARIGNADLVRGISDCLSVTRMVEEMAPSTPVFEGLIAACARAFDSYHWLGEQELGDLRGALTDVRATAEQVLAEFENVKALTDTAAAELAKTGEDVASLVRRVRGESPRSADEWVGQLAELRRAQGRLETLRELRYVDTARIDAHAETLSSELDSAAQRAVEFLQGEDAFTGYHEKVEALVTEASAIRTVAEAGPVTSRLAEQAAGLEIVTEVVGSLDIGDATVRTKILERVGEVLGGVNRARATVDGRRRELLATEGRAAFAAEFALLGQSITGALAVADTPRKCDEQLGRLLLQLENLESRFSEFDDFLVELTAKRTDVYEAFSSRKQALVDEQARRADRLVDSASRILTSITRRVATLSTVDDINTYFASDPMVAKVRSVADDLRALDDTVRAEELDGRLKAARQEAARSLRDRADLFGDGGETVRLGRHRFAVNTQAVDLTLVPKDGEMALAVTGTDFRTVVRDAEFGSTKDFWDQFLVSETADVYRAEYLATSVLAEGVADDADVLDVVRRAAESRYDEGYERGVHDHDAAAILEVLQRLLAGAGLLRYPAAERALAQLFWAHGVSDDVRKVWSTRAGSLARARKAFGPVPAIASLCAELAVAIDRFPLATGNSALAAEYLFEELGATPLGFVTSAGARTLVERFRRALGGRREFDDDLRALDDLEARYQLATAWLSAFVSTQDELPADELPEAVALLLCDLPRHDSSAAVTATVEGLLGAHPRVVGGRMTVRLDEILARTRTFRLDRVPAFRAYQKHRNELLTRERARLRLEEFAPKVMSAFVRNKLLDEVYLPLIGDNLAKQLGAVGEAKRTDQMGLLLLISPPGYGKTTLMEYVANRLGLVFVKVNGPALGHDVTSLDPADAPNATARQEVEKISFALELGNNVLLYLDDIQHTSPELLQKFISLCDAQRRMEGVWEGRTRTYDLRGKRFAVCMAGNPYTEAGKRFRIPDMLANRADVWNLGDVLSGREDEFALSYLENSLTSNQVLSPLSTRDRGDLELLLRLARGEEVRSDRLSHPYSAVELDQLTSVLRKLLRVQEVVLANNKAYIASAAQADSSRTEPPFLLQGSYRNMNKLAERIVPAMNDQELEAAIDDHYAGEAQTLTSGAEANLLKLAELRGSLTPEMAARWTDVKAAYLRDKALGGAEDDPMVRAVGAVGLLADRVAAVESAITRASQRIG